MSDRSTELRAQLKKAGETQAGLAHRLGVDPSTVRRWLLHPSKSSHRNMPEPMWRAAKRLLEG